MVGLAPTAQAAPSAGVIVTVIDGDTVEDGSNGLVRLQLSIEPTAPVTISVSSQDVTEGTVATSSIVLDSTNWFDGFDLSVTPGSSGDGNDGDVMYQLAFGDPMSTDPAYDAHGRRHFHRCIE